MNAPVSPKILYHLEELKIANSPNSVDYIQPTFLETDQAILDIGCGIGQSLVNNSCPQDRLLVGVDIDLESICYGKEHYSQVQYANCTAEKLPFDSDSFDCVMSRVAVPYTNIPETLTEIARVLKPGGHIWITLHPYKMTLRQLKTSILRGNIKDCIFRTFVLFNGTSFHFFNKLFQFPANKNYESFQTERGITHCLQLSGFSEIKIERGRHFLCSAVKSHGAPKQSH